MYISTLSLTSAVGGQRHAPAALPLEKTQYPLYRKLGGPQVWVGTENLTPTRIPSPDHPAHSESLYQLYYPSPHQNKNSYEKLYTFCRDA